MEEKQIQNTKNTEKFYKFIKIGSLFVTIGFLSFQFRVIYKAIYPVLVYFRVDENLSYLKHIFGVIYLPFWLMCLIIFAIAIALLFVIKKFLDLYIKKISNSCNNCFVGEMIQFRHTNNTYNSDKPSIGLKSWNETMNFINGRFLEKKIINIISISIICCLILFSLYYQVGCNKSKVECFYTSFGSTEIKTAMADSYYSDTYQYMVGQEKYDLKLEFNNETNKISGTLLKNERDIKNDVPVIGEFINEKNQRSIGLIAKDITQDIKYVYNLNAKQKKHYANEYEKKQYLNESFSDLDFPTDFKSFKKYLKEEEKQNTDPKFLTGHFYDLNSDNKYLQDLLLTNKNDVKNIDPKNMTLPRDPFRIVSLAKQKGEYNIYVRDCGDQEVKDITIEYGFYGGGCKNRGSNKLYFFSSESLKSNPTTSNPFFEENVKFKDKEEFGAVLKENDIITFESLFRSYTEDVLDGYRDKNPNNKEIKQTNINHYGIKNIKVLKQSDK